ncbi:MAG: site-specific integrase [Treponema sp.]|nr:site-specific integrase [Treponema sp.]
MRQFYLYPNASGYFNVIFIDPITGKKITDKSTHTKDQVEAAVIATTWLQNGIPEARPNSRSYYTAGTQSKLNLKTIAETVTEGEAQTLINLLAQRFNLAVPSQFANTEKNFPVQSQKTQKTAISKPQETGIPLISFLRNFWDYDNSEFIKRYLAHGHNMTKRHTDMMLGLVKNYWGPYFGDEITVQELDRTTLDDFFFYLHTEKQLSGGTVNKAINCGSRAMRYLFENNKIESNPMAGIERFNAEELERGIPTESEVKKLLKVDWLNETYRLAFKLGIYCGLRAGEISGLRVCDLDLDADLIHVQHSWNDTDGLKKPKNSDVRDLPIDHETLEELYALAKQNPYFSDLSYVFFSAVKPEQPCWPSYYVDGLYDALEKIGVSEEQRKERNIVFHSLRHFCATILSQRTDLKTVQAVMGHRSEDMSKHYSNHETEEKINNMRNVMQLTWNDIMSA